MSNSAAGAPLRTGAGDRSGKKTSNRSLKEVEQKEAFFAALPSSAGGDESCFRSINSSKTQTVALPHPVTHGRACWQVLPCLGFFSLYKLF